MLYIGLVAIVPLLTSRFECPVLVLALFVVSVIGEFESAMLHTPSVTIVTVQVYLRTHQYRQRKYTIIIAIAIYIFGPIVIHRTSSRSRRCN